MNNLTVKEMIHAMQEGDLTSYTLTSYYLAQINQYNDVINAVSQINPNALLEAQTLDAERKQKGPRSPLHGLPVLLKDNINTTDGLFTTANSYALSDLKTPYEATLVKNLKDWGVLILGKANLSEFAYFMSYDDMPSGFGSLNGQVKSPYHHAIDPLGSSTGSAVSVACDMVIFSVGTETNGSLMAPAYRNSIVSIKPTLGLVSRYGIIPISEHQDTAGPMAKTVMDCAYLLEALVGSDDKDPYTKKADELKQPYHTADQLSIAGKRIGILKFTNYAYTDEELAILDEAKEKLEAQGVTVTWYNFELKHLKNDASLLFEFKHGLNNYLKSVSGATKMTSLADIIKFNNENKDRCLKYGQSILTKSEETTGDLNDPEFLKVRQSLLKEARKFQDLMEKDQLDALISTKWLSYGPIYGNPSICVPGKKLIDQKPVSVVFIGKKYDEMTLISLAHHYEINTKHRIAPKLIKTTK